MSEEDRKIGMISIPFDDYQKIDTIRAERDRLKSLAMNAKEALEKIGNIRHYDQGNKAIEIAKEALAEFPKDK
jgi:hypothetical protein